ncbi:MAG: holo-ACP synthase [Thermosulfidibacteraceae bacterium]|jgi:holo-[acyl-carrier protein] synthase
MIKGIGIDIVDNRRVASILEKWGDKFLKRVFGEEELKFIELSGRKVEIVASRWALKEAVVKATGFTEKRKIEIAGKGKDLRIKIEGFEGSFLCSISHERNYSMAFVIWIWNNLSPGT